MMRRESPDTNRNWKSSSISRFPFVIYSRILSQDLEAVTVENSFFVLVPMGMKVEIHNVEKKCFT